MKIVKWMALGLAVVLLSAAACGRGGSGISDVMTMMPAAGAGTGAGAGGEGGGALCSVVLTNAGPGCSLCAQTNCCSLLEACNRLDCLSCATGIQACTDAGRSATTVYTTCLNDNCIKECGFSAGVAGGAGGGGGVGGVTCATSADCPSATPCCEVTALGPSHCAATTDKQCRCLKGSDCSSGACAPAVDTLVGAPVGPYVCVPNDAKPYHGCSGALNACGAGYCCFTDALDNEFCGAPCDPAFCLGLTSCNSYSNAHSSCMATKGCGPQ